MNLDELGRAWAVIQTVAANEGKTPAEVRASVKEAIDEAWAFSRHDPAAKAAWDRYFPSGKKPTVEAFIVHLADYIY